MRGKRVCRQAFQNGHVKPGAWILKTSLLRAELSAWFAFKIRYVFVWLLLKICSLYFLSDDGVWFSLCPAGHLLSFLDLWIEISSILEIFLLSFPVFFFFLANFFSFFLQYSSYLYVGPSYMSPQVSSTLFWFILGGGGDYFENLCVYRVPNLTTV